VIVLGEKARLLLAPTVTIWTPGVEDEVVDAGAAAAEEVVAEPAGAPYWASANGRRHRIAALIQEVIFEYF
jgi:hypothetical protein